MRKPLWQLISLFLFLLIPSVLLSAGDQGWPAFVPAGSSSLEGPAFAPQPDTASGRSGTGVRSRTQPITGRHVQIRFSQQSPGIYRKNWSANTLLASAPKKPSSDVQFCCAGHDI